MKSRKRTLIKHTIHCQWMIRLNLNKNKKSYYFRKQIEVANRLLKKLK
jgi:hypothetical protein